MFRPYPPTTILGPNYVDPSGFGAGILPSREVGSELSLKIPKNSFAAVLVTSTKKVKTGPVENLCQELFGTTKNWRLEGIKTASGVPEQPYGKDEGLLGARQRAQSPQIIERLQQIRREGKLALVFSIENYLERESTNLELPEKWIVRFGRQYLNSQRQWVVDRSAISIELHYGEEQTQLSLISDGVILPIKYLEAAEANPERSRTAGHFIHQDLGLDSGNWHQDFTDISRAQIIENSLSYLSVR